MSKDTDRLLKNFLELQEANKKNAAIVESAGKVKAAKKGLFKGWKK